MTLEELKDLIEEAKRNPKPPEGITCECGRQGLLNNRSLAIHRRSHGHAKAMARKAGKP